MKKGTKNFLIIFSSLIAVSFLIEFVIVARDLIISRKQIKSIQVQKEILQGNLDKVTHEFEAASNELSMMKEKLSASEKDNAQLRKDKQELEQRVVALEGEKRAIQAKLHSLPELKKCIRQVKIEIRGQKIQQHLAKKQLQKEIDAQKLAAGNRGFLMLDSKSTYKPTIKIEVKPVY